MSGLTFHYLKNDVKQDWFATRIKTCSSEWGGQKVDVLFTAPMQVLVITGGGLPKGCYVDCIQMLRTAANKQFHKKTQFLFPSQKAKYGLSLQFASLLICQKHMSISNILNAQPDFKSTFTFLSYLRS